MMYIVFPRGDLGWDDIRIYTTFSAVERLLHAGTYAIGYEGADELIPVWLFQMESGRIRRYPVNR
jgi:hypothetical protein